MQNRQPHSPPRVVRRLLGAAASVVALVASVLVLTPGAASGATVTGLTPIEFTEDGGPVPVAPNGEIDEAGSFADGYIQFSVAGATAEETLFLPEAASPGTDAGQVTVIGSAVYLGLGGGQYKQIGTVDSTNDGQQGRPLRVNFSAALPNSSFSEGTDGSGNPTGWTINRQHVNLGALASKTQGRPVTISGSAAPYTITGPGYSFQTDWNYAASEAGWRVEGLEKPLTNAGNWYSEITSYSGSTSSLRLYFTTNCQGTNKTPPYCSVFGPDAWSSPFDAKAGDDLAFDWAAANGGDDYEVYGFLVNTATNAHTELMYGRGRLAGWSTAAGQIPADGNYRFRFVTGSFDATGGLAIGASLYIDNIRVLSSDASAAVAQSVLRLVHYDNSSDNPPPTRTISVETGIPGQPPTTETIPTEVTGVDDAPTISAMPPVTYTNTAATDSFTMSTGSVPGSDPEGDPITYSLVDGVAGSTVLGGHTYDTSKAGERGTLHLDSATGAWAFVPDADAINAQLTSAEEAFGIVATANGLTGSADLTVRVAVTPAPPAAPTGLVATPDDRAVDLSWDAPTWVGGSPVTGYRIEMDSGAGYHTLIANTGSTVTTQRIMGLPNGVTRSFRVYAINANGVSVASDPASATPVAVPGAPTDLAAVPGDGQAELSWTAPADDGGTPVTGYRIETSTDGSTWTVVVADTGSTATAATVSGLTNGVPTSFRVSATNAVGTGAPSAPETTTPRRVPTEPRSLTATPNDGEVTLSWTEPASDGGAPITGYLIERSVDGSTWVVLAADTGTDATTYTVAGLTNGEAASYRVSAINAAGTGPASDPVSSTPRRVPTAPTITSIKAGNRTLTVSFTAPSDDGGAPVTNYQYSIDGGTTWVTRAPAGTTSPLVIQPLANGTTYPVLLRAVNAAGAGAASAMVPGTPVLGVVTVPDVPGGFGGTGGGSGGKGGSGGGSGNAGSNVLVGGVPESSTTAIGGRPGGEAIPTGTARVQGGGVTVDVTGLDDDGKPTPTDPSGRLVFQRGRSTMVTGSGFEPGSTVDVWMAGAGVLLGQVTVGPDGSFSAPFDLPEDLELGEEEIQLNGVGSDGSTRTVSLDVLVMDAEAERSPAPRGTAPAPRERRLAITGSDVTSLVLLGLVLCIAGAVTELTRRRRLSD